METGYGHDLIVWNRYRGAGAARGRRYGQDERVRNPYGGRAPGYGTGFEGARAGYRYSGGENFGGSYGGGYGADHLTGRSGGAWRRYATDYSPRGRGYDAGLGRRLRQGWRELARGARRILPGYDRRW